MFIPTVKSRVGEDISILIQLDNHSVNYICECGDASDLTVKECQNTAVIFISHTHIDHFINFDFILRHQIGIGKKVIVCGPQGITQQVQAKIRGYQWNLIEAGSICYEIREIINENEIKYTEIHPPTWDLVPLQALQSNSIYANDRFEVNFTILDHKTESIAYRFKEKDVVKIDLSKSQFKGGKWVKELKEAFSNEQPDQLISIEDQNIPAQELYHLLEIKRGDTLGVIMDHAANAANHQKIIDLFQNCNKAFIECFYKAEDREFAQLNFHSYSSASAEIMKKCAVQHPIPVHFSRKYRAEEIDTLLAEFHQGFQ